MANTCPQTKEQKMQRQKARSEIANAKPKGKRQVKASQGNTSYGKMVKQDKPFVKKQNTHIRYDEYVANMALYFASAAITYIHPHMFRHTFVSLLMSNPDIGVATVAAEAGHAQPSTTLMIYTQQYKKRRESIRNQLSRELYEK